MSATTPLDKWWRLCLDIDSEGNLIGASTEHRVRDTCNRIDVHPTPGPFETPTERLSQMVDNLPVQMRLFT